MNCLYTINLNNFMGRKARASFLSAARRWECEYREITEPCDEFYPGCQKFKWAHRLDFSKLMYLDADAVISEHSPNPFELCEVQSRLYVVSDYYGPNISDAWKLYAFHEPIQRALKRRRGRLMSYEQFFNAGMFIFQPDPIMADFFDTVYYSMEGPDKLDEQAMFNLLAFNSPDVYLRYLPETWNYMVRKETGPKPEYYINHYGGSAQPLIADSTLTEPTPEPNLCTSSINVAAPAGTAPLIT